MHRYRSAPKATAAARLTLVTGGLIALLGAGCGGGGSTGPGTDVDLLYEETFDTLADGSVPTAWTLLTQSEATVETPFDWKVLSHRLHQASNIQAPASPGLSYASDYEGTLAVVGDTSWVNVSLRADVIPRDDDGIGVIFRWRESATDAGGDFYRLLMLEDAASGGPKLRLDKRIGGVWTVIDELIDPDYGGYDENRRYVVEIDMVVSDFTVKIDGEIRFEFNDPDLPSGKIGFFCYAEEGADFDNIRVYRRGP